MKSKIIVGISLILIILATTALFVVINNKNSKETYDALLTLSDFSMQKFEDAVKSSEYIAGLTVSNGSVDINREENILKVDIKVNGLSYFNEFRYENSALYAKIYSISKIDEITYNIYDIAYSINYPDNKGVVLDYILKSDTSFFNLDNVGMRIADDLIVMYVDRPINFIDFKSLYITKEDIETSTSNLKEDKLIKLKNDNISVIKTGKEHYMIISVAEKKELTESAFKSIISIMGFLLDYSEVYEKFVNEHLDMKFTNELNDQYLLEIDPRKEAYELAEFGTDPMIRLTIYGN